MKSDTSVRPIVRKATARALYLKISAEWMTGRQRVPSVALADAESAARAVLARHACQPKSHIKLPRLDRSAKSSATP
ncbi:MAG: hypothetical protein WCK77_25870 [Verrucomicrobiota bacterium]